MEPHSENEGLLRGQDIPYPATRGDITPPLEQEVVEPETMFRSLTPNMDADPEPEGRSSCSPGKHTHTNR